MSCQFPADSAGEGGTSAVAQGWSQDAEIALGETLLNNKSRINKFLTHLKPLLEGLPS